MSSRYAKNAEAVHPLKDHLVGCPKYRRPVLTPPVDERRKELLTKTAAEYAMSIQAMDVMPHHLHLVVEADPTLSVAEIVSLQSSLEPDASH